MLKKSAQILKNNLIFIQPLLLFLLIFMTASTFVIHKNIYMVSRIAIIVSMSLLFVAFMAGWLQVNKYGVLNYDEKDMPEQIAEKALQNIKKFFEGVGANFLRTLYATLILTVVYVLITFGLYKLCMHFFGEPTVVNEILKIAKSSSQAEMLNIYNGISQQDKIIFSNWVLSFGIALLIFNFFSLLYYTVLNFEKDNIFKSLWIAIVFMFKNIGKTILVILFVLVLNVLLNLLSVVVGTSSFSFILLILLLTIYLNYYVLLVFCFYYDNAKNNSNSWS